MASSDTALVCLCAGVLQARLGGGFRLEFPFQDVWFPPVSRQQSHKQQLLFLLQAGVLVFAAVCSSGVSLSSGGSP